MAGGRQESKDSTKESSVEKFINTVRLATFVQSCILLQQDELDKSTGGRRIILSIAIANALDTQIHRRPRANTHQSLQINNVAEDKAAKDAPDDPTPTINS